MRHLFLIILCSTFLETSCKKTNSVPVIPNGTYNGIFQRQTSTGGQISNVTITFSENTWTGQSQFEKYPALCHGTYKTKSTDEITFENACPWTAEFDWSLVLGHDYKIKIVNTSIEITRDYANAVKDIYKLTKQ